MSRLKIEIPDEFIFSTEIPVLIEHINYGAHLGNDSYLSILHEARIRFLESLGVSELSISGTIGIVLTDSYIGYKKEAHRGDILKVYVTIQNISRLECDFYYKITSVKSGALLTVAKTGAAFFDFKPRALAPLPKEALAILSSSLSQK